MHTFLCLVKFAAATREESPLSMNSSSIFFKPSVESDYVNGIAVSITEDDFGVACRVLSDPEPLSESNWTPFPLR